jgi:hypothetical protein
VSPEDHLKQAEKYLTQAYNYLNSSDARAISAYAQLAEAHISVATHRRMFGLDD